MATGNHKVEIIVTARDLATQSLRNVEAAVGGLGRGFTGINTFFTGFRNNLDTSIRKLDRLANSLYRFNMYTSNIQRNLTAIGTLGGLAAGAVAYQGVTRAVGFDHTSRVMQSRMNVSDNVREEVERFVLDDLNMRVSFTPGEIMDMGVIFGQSGVANANDMKALMDATTYFSETVDAVPEQAAEMIIAAAKGFNISMEDASSITDKLTMAVNSSLLHVEEMPHALGQLAGRAALYGQTLDSSLVALMASRDQGLSAAQASQNLLNGLRQISMIGNEMALYPRRKQFFTELGVDTSFFDEEKAQLKEFPEIIKSLEKTMVDNDFINERYRDQIKSFSDFEKLRDSGELPADFWDSQQAAPLLTRVFGAAGMTPIMMGLQTQFEEVDPETGETVATYYGSRALDKMQERVANSEGETKRTHAVVEESAQFQLEVLKGAWEATQIKFLDGTLPLIKAISGELTSWFMGEEPGERQIHGLDKPQMIGPDEPTSRIDRIEQAILDTAENFREEGHTTTANIIETVGTGIMDVTRIGSTTGPLFSQFGTAFKDNFISAEWGSNILEFPWHMVENGIGFIKDVLSANEEFNALVQQLPENLQNPAKLVESLSKAGLTMLVTGAIVKVIELGVRGVSTALKVGKLALDLSTYIVDMVKNALGLGSGESPGDLADDLLGNTANINADVVNVYGKTINDKTGGKDGKGDGKKTPPVIYGPDGKPVEDNKGGGNKTPPVIYGPDGEPIESEKDKKDSGGNKSRKNKMPKIPVGAGGLLDILTTLSLGTYLGGLAGDYILWDSENRGPMKRVLEAVSPYRRPGETYDGYLRDTSNIPKNTELKPNNKSQPRQQVGEYGIYGGRDNTGRYGLYGEGAPSQAILQQKDNNKSQTNNKQEIRRNVTREVNLKTKSLEGNLFKEIDNSKNETKRDISTTKKSVADVGQAVISTARLQGGYITKNSSNISAVSAGLSNFKDVSTREIDGAKKSVVRMDHEVNATKTFAIGGITSIGSSLVGHREETKSSIGALNAGLSSHREHTLGGFSSLTEGLRSTDSKIGNVSNSIIDGFAVANQRLQNVRVDNQVNVNVPPANITINGNVREHITSVNQSRPNTTVSRPSTPRRTPTPTQLGARRFGWR